MAKNDRVNILLVDDQPGKLLTYEAILKDLDANLIKAGSAREALDCILHTDIAVVLMDVCMPDLDGFEVATMIRQHPRYQKTAIILVSAVLLTDLDRLKGFEHGAVDYIAVPIVPEILRAKVGVFVDLYRKSHELERLNVELEQRVAQRTADLESYVALLRESEAEHRLTLESALDCVIVMDQEGMLVGFNAAAERTFGYRREEVVGRVLADVLIPARLRGAHRHGIKRLLETGESVLIGRRVEMSALRADGTEFPIEISISEIHSPSRSKNVLFTGFLRDITEHKQAQDERASLLESERSARSEAERANRAKDQFFATVSHELRTPLNAVLLWAQLLRRNLEDKNGLVEGLEAIERGGRAQARLIDDLLDMSRIMSGKLHLELGTVDLNSIIETAVTTIRPVAQSKSMEIRQNLDPRVGSVRGDPARLQQVLWNLLSNAVKFTPQGGTIHVELTQRDGRAEIAVRDSGMGITPEFLVHVFESFQQADSSTTRRSGGLGLGLAITKHLVELHGGTIEVMSPGKGLGTTVHVLLPLSFDAFEVEPVKSGRGSERPFTSELGGIRVLVVDDDPDGCEILRRVLEDCEARVEVSASAEEALMKIDTFRPHLLVSDIGMPGRDGYGLIRDIRERATEAVRATPAVAVTAYARPEDRIRVLQAGFDMYVSKPIDRSELLRVLSTLVRRGRERGVVDEQTP